MNITDKFKNLKININLDNLTEIAKKAAMIGSDLISSNYNKIQSISCKGRAGDLVTNVDLEVEKKIKDYLLDQTPEITILAEETGQSNKSSDLIWCIDPLDGTTNYSHGYPFFGTSIGLVYMGIPILGSISIPYLNELYWGCITKGSYCNNEIIKVSNPINLSESLLVTGFAYDRFETENNNYAEFCWLTHKTRGVRRSGAAAIDLAFVAAGKADGFWERGLQIWDIAAGAIIVYEAGGIVSNYPNGELDVYSGKILACSPNINVELKDQLSQVKPFDFNIYT